MMLELETVGINTLVLATPRADIDQTIRKLKKISANGSSGLIVDLLDSIPFAATRFRQRQLTVTWQGREALTHHTVHGFWP